MRSTRRYSKHSGRVPLDRWARSRFQWSCRSGSWSWKVHRSWWLQAWTKNGFANHSCHRIHWVALWLRQSPYPSQLGRSGIVQYASLSPAGCWGVAATQRLVIPHWSICQHVASATTSSPCSWLLSAPWPAAHIYQSSCESPPQGPWNNRKT